MSKTYAEFLTDNGLFGKLAMEVLESCGIESLQQLLRSRADATLANETAAALEAKVKGAGASFKAIEIAALKNAIYYADNASGASDATALAELLVESGVLPADTKKHDRALYELRECSVVSLSTFKAFKERKPPTPASLTDAIAAWQAPSSVAAFEALTAASVARWMRRTTAVEPELKAFLTKQRLPAGTEEVLAAYGVTTLEQLRSVKEDDGKSKELQARLASSGILNANEQFEGVKVEDIEKEIAICKDPVGQSKGAKDVAELSAAIKEVEELRTRLSLAAATDADAVKAEVDRLYKGVLEKVKDVFDADFSRARTGAATTRSELDSMMSTMITNATTAKKALAGIDTSVVSLVDLVDSRSMLSGFLITPAEVAHKRGGTLVKVTSGLDTFVVSPGVQRSHSVRYVGRKTESFAVASASDASSALASTAEASGAWFVGAGVAAVSAAASYADAHRSSKEERRFESQTTYTRGQVDFLFAPKRRLRFRTSELALGVAARTRLEAIATALTAATGAATPAATATARTALVAFFRELGSHFFLDQILGGRFELDARGTTTTSTAKTNLVEAVAATSNWAASASGSYAGIGGAGTAAAAVHGQKGSASADAKRFELEFGESKVTVNTTVLGGAGMVPQDIWMQSLAHNSTWEVIDRSEPIGIWTLVQNDATASAAVRKLAPLMEEVWVRELFLPSVKETNRLLHDRLAADAGITTCNRLEEVIRALPEQVAAQGVEVFVARSTSGTVEHPAATAISNAEHMKLIGGGAFVDYGDGAGSLLCGSYPEGNGWRATAKSHHSECAAKVTAYAIYLYDPFDLWEVIQVSQRSEKSARPTAVATLPAGYTLVGGGARVEWETHGLMLTDSCPDLSSPGGRAWMARGKDHKLPEHGAVTAWAIGVKSRSGEALAYPLSTVMDHAESSGGIRVDVTVSPKAGRVILGGGAAVSYSGDGALLFGSGLSDDLGSWRAAGKDHVLKDPSLRVRTWVISAPGKLHVPR